MILSEGGAKFGVGGDRIGCY